MTEIFITLMEFLLLLAANILSGALGFLPSFIMTAVNIKSFGLEAGAVLTLLGEILGALAGFHLYRYGFAKAKPTWQNHRYWKFWQEQPDSRVFLGVVVMRLVPFVPSGLVTAGAALTKIRAWPFMAASTTGKVPAVALELAAVYGFVQFVPPSLQFAALGAVLVFIAWSWQKRRLKS
jgi:uncharacterized membrane protein YdjX (TVP38/TMEM64 family)